MSKEEKIRQTNELTKVLIDGLRPKQKLLNLNLSNAKKKQKSLTKPQLQMVDEDINGTFSPNQKRYEDSRFL